MSRLTFPPSSYKLRGKWAKKLSRLVKPEGFVFEDYDLVIMQFDTHLGRPVVEQVLRSGAVVWTSKVKESRNVEETEKGQ